MPGTEDISSMVEKIMKNPEFAGIVNELRGTEAGTQSEVTTNDMLSHLPEVVSMLKPFLGDSSSASSSGPDQATQTSDSDTPTSSAPEAQKVSAPPLPKKYDKSRAEKLMSALKPYLNSNRCEIIDRCVSVMQITDVMEALQGIEGITKMNNK